MSIQTEIRAVELERLLRGDTTLLEDAFVGIGPLGFMLSKAEWIERHMTGKLTYESYALDKEEAAL